MAKIELKNVMKIFPGNVRAVDSLSLDVADKEFLAIIGPSGCGKSTLLRLIAGLEHLTEGQIFIAEKNMGDVPARDRNISMVFQNYALFPHLNVFENIAFGLRARKVPKDEIKKLVTQAVELLNISHLLKRKPRQLSGGERQRVAMGRAIVRKPHVFLMDEPLSNLDAQLRIQMRAEIKKLHKDLQSTFIYVTHDYTEAMTLADRLAVMKDGKIVQIGQPKDVYQNPNSIFVAKFLGTPSMNILENYSSEASVGIRPEDVLLNTCGDDIQQNAQVEFIEIMGNENIGHFSTDWGPVAVRYYSADIHEIQPGEQVHLTFPEAKLLYFDKETGLRIINEN